MVDRVAVGGTQNRSRTDLDHLGAFGDNGRRVELKDDGLVVDYGYVVRRGSVDRQVGRIDGEGIVRVGEPHGEIDRRRGDRRLRRRVAGQDADRQALESAVGVESPARGHDPAERGDRVDAVENRVANLLEGGVGCAGPSECGGAGDVRRGHAAAAIRSVTPTRQRAVNVRSRGPQIDGAGAVVAKQSKVVVMIGGGDGQDVGQVEAGRIVWLHVVVDVVVAGRRHEEDSGLAAGLDGVVECLAEASAAPTVVGHAKIDAIDRAHHRGVVHRLDRGAGEAVAFGIEKLQRHHRAVPVDARHPLAVVTHAGDGSRHVRSVAVVVHGIAVVVGKVVPVHVVHEPVAVVVDPIAGHLGRIRPDVGGQVGVVVVDARIDDPNHDAPAPRGEIPGLRGVDVGIDRSAGLPRVVQAPETVEFRVVGDGLGHED